jgi:hypothetical protein
LASSARYPNQAFRVGERAWGLQFHVEADEPAVAAYVDAFAPETHHAEHGAAGILAAAPAAIAALAPVRTAVLGGFASLL